MAAPDSTPPKLTSLVIPTTLDETASTGSPYDSVFVNYATFTAGATDAGLGVDHVTLTLDHARSYGGPFDTVTIGGGDASVASFASGPQSALVYFDPAFSSRTYHVTQAAVYDRAGNVATYTAAQLAALGVNTSIAVTSPAAADAIPPTLTGLSLPATVDLAAGATVVPVNITAAAQDASGIYGVQLAFDRVLGSPTLYGNTEPALTTSLGIPASAVSDTIHLTSATVYDRAGNAAIYSAAQLAAAGYNTTIQVRGPAPADIVAPRLTALTVPTTVDITSGQAVAPFALTVDETGSGIADIKVQLDRPIDLDYPYQYAPHGAGRYGGPLLTATLDASAPDTQATYGSSLSFHQDGATYSIRYVAGVNLGGAPVSTLTAAGPRNVTGVTLTDNAGNVSTYNADQLRALGVNTAFSVVDNSVPPTLAGLTLPGTVPFDGKSFAFSVSIAGGTTAASTQAVLELDRPVTGFSPGYPTSDVVFGAFAGGTAAAQYTRTASLGTGLFTVRDLLISDGHGGNFLYTADQLRAQGFATSFTFAGQVAGDFDGNGFSDLLWRRTDGAVSTWSASAGSGGRDAIRQDTFDANPSASWHATDTFDWNGDGRADILWRNDNGALSIWTGAAAGGFRQAAYNDTSIPAGWSVAGTGDIDGDGKVDLLWRNADGALSTWMSTGTGFTKNAYYHVPVGGGWQVEGLGDFNGDGRDDILWRNANGAVSVWNDYANGPQEGSLLHAPVVRAWHIVGIGDTNGDGRDDIVWRNDNGAVTVWQGDPATPGGFDESRQNARAGTDWRVASVGDYDGDGRADLLWRNAAGAVSIWHSTGADWQQNSYLNASVGNDWAIVAHDYVL